MYTFFVFQKGQGKKNPKTTQQPQATKFRQKVF